MHLCEKAVRYLWCEGGGGGVSLNIKISSCLTKNLDVEKALKIKRSLPPSNYCSDLANVNNMDKFPIETPLSMHLVSKDLKAFIA